MYINNYRVKFSSFQQDKNTSLYKGWRSKNPIEPLWTEIFERYQDLFSITMLEELKDAIELTHTEIEKRSLTTLLIFSMEMFLESQSRPVSLELSETLKRISINWQGKTLAFHKIEKIIAQSKNKNERYQLANIFCNELLNISDLYLEKNTKETEAIRKLNNLGIEIRNYEQEKKLVKQCLFFLDTTATVYNKLLSEWAPTDQFLDSPLQRADELVLYELSSLNEFVQKKSLLSIYNEMLRGFGAYPWQQKNLEFCQSEFSKAVCARVNIPENIKILFNSCSSWINYQDFFYVAGKAQHAAWTSINLPIELRYEGDRAISESYGKLFKQLMLDRHWIAKFLDVQLPTKFNRLLMLSKLHEVRKTAIITLQKLNTQNLISHHEATQQIYQATKFQYSVPETIYEFSNNEDSICNLRAYFFEAQLRDYLRTKYNCWWESKKARDLLIDLWNTGFRYTLDELAFQIGLGQITPEALIEDFTD